MKSDKKTKHVWVVEMQLDAVGEYTPTVGCGLSREDGREKLAEWKAKCVCDNFRLAKYVRVGK